MPYLTKDLPMGRTLFLPIKWVEGMVLNGEHEDPRVSMWTTGGNIYHARFNTRAEAEDFIFDWLEINRDQEAIKDLVGDEKIEITDEPPIEVEEPADG
jgi:hypothetical protein